MSSCLNSDTNNFELYHATNESRARKIMSSQFECRINKSHWLGQGAYFYKYLQHAIEWCMKTDYIKKSSVIIMVHIEISNKNHFDLNNPNHLNSFIKFLVEKYIPIVLKEKNLFASYHKFICSAIDYLTEIIESIYLISFSFSMQNILKKPLFRKSIVDEEFVNNNGYYRYQLNELQFCVTQKGLLNNIIKNKEIIDLEKGKSDVRFF